MRKDIQEWCRACEVCFTRRAGSQPHVPLTPIPVSGPWDRVGVDMLQLPRSHNGNHYLVVFIDYLTKWVEAFATPDQTALTIAHLLEEEVVTRHWVPNTLLSDRGPNFPVEIDGRGISPAGGEKAHYCSLSPSVRWAS